MMSTASFSALQRLARGRPCTNASLLQKKTCVFRPLTLARTLLFRPGSSCCGAQFYDYLQANPEIRGAWHGCGPGNTFSMIRAPIGGERVRAFPSAEMFRQEVEQ
jgi:hypothetical protein